MGIVAGLSATPFSDVVAVYSMNEMTWMLARSTKEDLTAPFHRSVIGLKVFGPKDPVKISGDQFVRLLSGLEWAYFELCKYLYENKTECCKNSNFSTPTALMKKLAKVEMDYFREPRTPGVTLGPLGGYMFLRPTDTVGSAHREGLKKGSKGLERAASNRVIMAQSRRVFGCALPPTLEDSSIECTGHLMVSTIANIMDALAPITTEATQFTYALTRYALPSMST